MPDEEQAQVISGTIENIVFHSDETYFTVFELDCGGILVTAVGKLVDLGEGEEVELTGTYTNHAIFGRQFKVISSVRKLPAGAAAIGKYLSSGVIKGIGPAIAKRIVERFGDETLTVIEKSPEKLAQITGISRSKAAAIKEEYDRAFGVRSVMLFLAGLNLPPAVGVKIWKRWGADSVEAIEKNPYLLMSVGVSFADIEPINAKLGLGPANPDRVRAGLRHVLSHNLGNGHTCIPRDKLVPAAEKLLGVAADPIEMQLDNMAEEGELAVFKSGERAYIYLAGMYNAESYVAGRISLVLRSVPRLDKRYDKEIAELEKKIGITYDEIQKEAINKALCSHVFILTGGPGTGKTTTLNALITLLEDQGEKVVLCAPTGRSAKRMTELCGREAKTIHRLLEVEFDEDDVLRFKRNEKNNLQADTVVIDEMSMVDESLMASLLKALKLNCRVIMVGDSDQLPSVGAGNVLKDLIDSGRVDCVELKKIFRQAAQSLIVTNAHAIVSGQHPDIAEKDNDFFFVRKGTYDAVSQAVLELCCQRITATYGIPVEDIQILSPTRKDQLGTEELNRLLQYRLNPPGPSKKEFKHQGAAFRDGDKVMQIKNNYDIIWQKEKDSEEKGTGLFNGDIGRILAVDTPRREALIRFDDRLVSYPFDIAGELALAYAATVHKSQGSEFEAVIIPLMRPNPKLYFRNLLYTAVTRAKKLLVVVGNPEWLYYMVDNNKKTLRYTNLAKLLRKMGEA